MNVAYLTVWSWTQNLFHAFVFSRFLCVENNFYKSKMDITEQYYYEGSLHIWAFVRIHEKYSLSHLKMSHTLEELLGKEPLTFSPKSNLK